MCCWGLIARQDIPHPSTKPSLFGAVWNTVLLKSAGRCRLVIQLTQWRRTTSVTAIFFFFYPAAYNKSREMCLFSFGTQQQTTEQLWGKFSSEALFLFKLYVAWKSKQTLGQWIPSLLGLVVSCFHIAEVETHFIPCAASMLSCAAYSMFKTDSSAICAKCKIEMVIFICSLWSFYKIKTSRFQAVVGHFCCNTNQMKIM